MTSFPFLPLSPLSSPPCREINEALPNCRCALEIYTSEEKSGAARAEVESAGGGGKGGEDAIDETNRERFVIP